MKECYYAYLWMRDNKQNKCVWVAEVDNKPAEGKCVAWKGKDESDWDMTQNQELHEVAMSCVLTSYSFTGVKDPMMQISWSPFHPPGSNNANIRKQRAQRVEYTLLCSNYLETFWDSQSNLRRLLLAHGRNWKEHKEESQTNAPESQTNGNGTNSASGKPNSANGNAPESQTNGIGTNSASGKPNSANGNAPGVASGSHTKPIAYGMQLALSSVLGWALQ